MDYLDCIATFTKVLELSSFTKAGRNLRISAAAASVQVNQLESHLGVRLLNRTTRCVAPTGVGLEFYERAKRIAHVLERAEAAIACHSGHHQGVIRVMTSPSVGRRIIGPSIPDFHDRYPATQVRLRSGDHRFDFSKDCIDLAFGFVRPTGSIVMAQTVTKCEMVLVASPIYVQRHGYPLSPNDIIAQNHACFSSKEFHTYDNVWPLTTPCGATSIEVSSPYVADDGDTIVDWAVSGHGIANIPLFEVEKFIRSGDLTVVLPDIRPLAIELQAFLPKPMFCEPRVALFLDFTLNKYSATTAIAGDLQPSR